MLEKCAYENLKKYFNRLVFYQCVLLSLDVEAESKTDLHTCFVISMKVGYRLRFL